MPVPWYVQSVNECFYIPAGIPQKAVYRELASNSAIFSLHIRELFRYQSSTLTTAKLPLPCLLRPQCSIAYSFIDVRETYVNDGII